MPRAIPFVALAIYAALLLFFDLKNAESGPILALALLPVLLVTVFAAVHHAEVIAHLTGEPFGTLVLTVAVTVIEVALIAFLMLSEAASPTLVRDTVFSVVMIVCNGLVGLCVLLGGIRHGEQGFRTGGAIAYLTVVSAMATLTLIIPNYTLTTNSPTFSQGQLAFVSVVTLLLYAAFLYIQTVRHKDHFVSGDLHQRPDGHAFETRAVLTAAIFLVITLVAVILLAKAFSGVAESALERVGAPPSLIGVIVALLVLLPESVAAVIAARRDELQKSVNLALGSSLATIGLTIPAVAIVSALIAKPILLGLGPRDTVMLVLTLFISQLTFGRGRTNILNGFVHLMLFACFLLFIFLP